MKRQIVINCFMLVMLNTALALLPRKPCRSRRAEYGYVCVCDDTYCDDLNIQEPKSNEEYILVTSSESGDRFYYEIGKTYQRLNPNRQRYQNIKATLEINSAKTYQKVRGFGAAYPGAVQYLMSKISPNMQKCVYKSYFSQNAGMRYGYLRIPIGGTDFDISPWAYNEYPEDDIHLSNFTKLDERDVLRNKQLKDLMRISRNRDLKLLAAAWSPPPWMKANKKFTGLANNQILPKYYATWAKYHVKWFNLMRKDGIEFWSVSTGNEPYVSKVNKIFEETNWNASSQAKWIAEHFGPTIKSSEFSHLEIHGFDDSRMQALQWLSEMETSNSKSLNYISTIAVHGYSDFLFSSDILDKVAAKYPYKEILYTEMCYGIGFGGGLTGPRLGLWNRTEQFVKELIDNLNHSIVGHLDWNIILDEKGGPNNAIGGTGITDAPIILNKDYTEMYKGPLFYASAHFSKFILAGSVRIDAKLKGVPASYLQTVAFQRPDDKISIILYNNCTKYIDLTVKDASKRPFQVKLKPKSINSLVYSNDDDGDTFTSDEFSESMNIFVIPNLW